MEHAEAEKSHAVERYLLREMDDGEQERFEEHYFDCVPCASQVRSGERFIEAGRAVVRAGGVAVPVSPLREWFQYAAAAVLVALIGPAAVLVPAIGYRAYVAQQPADATERLELVKPRGEAIGVSRGPVQPPETFRADEPKLIDFPVPPEQPPYPHYEYVLRDASKKALFTLRITAEEAADPGYVSLPRSLPAGSYILELDGVREDGNRASISSKPIRVLGKGEKS